MTGSNWMHDWRGLHNHERHVEAAEGVYCLLVHSGCGDWCFPDRYCRCCLLVEFRLLTAERDALKANVVQAIGTDGVAGTACRCAEPDDTPDGMLHDAWSVIANAPVRGWGFSGLANKQEQEWIDAAKRWRDAWHKTLNPEPVPDPAPVPEWRRLVSDQQFRIPPDHPPLATVLHCLARIERGVAGDTHVLDSRDYLARIVAVCEGQVGDGWQADPDSARLPADVDVVTSLLNRITMWPIGSPPIIDWEDLGHGAAAWLRDLLKEQS